MRREKASSRENLLLDAGILSLLKAGSLQLSKTCHSDHTPHLKPRKEKGWRERRMEVRSVKAFSSRISGQRWGHKAACLKIQIIMQHRGGPGSPYFGRKHRALRALWNTTFIHKAFT